MKRLLFSPVYGSLPKMDEVKDILKDFLDRIDRISANSAAGQSSTFKSSARDSASQRSAEKPGKLEKLVHSSKISIFQVIKLVQCTNTGKLVIHNVLFVN